MDTLAMSVEDLAWEALAGIPLGLGVFTAGTVEYVLGHIDYDPNDTDLNGLGPIPKNPEDAARWRVNYWLRRMLKHKEYEFRTLPDQTTEYGKQLAQFIDGLKQIVRPIAP